MKKTKLTERFQQLAGIKPLYKTGKLNIITEQGIWDPNLSGSASGSGSAGSGSAGSGSAGSGSTSGSAGSGSTSGSAGSGSGGGCIVNQQAQSLVDQNPNMGSYGISQQFVNNMAGRPNSFYNMKIGKFYNKLMTLRTDYPSQGGYLGFCQGENPNWQAQLTNKWGYAQNCIQNPGTC